MTASGSNKNVVLIVVLVLVGGCVLCSVGAVVLGGIGFVTASGVSSPTGSGSPSGVAGAVEFVPPAPFEVTGEGRWRATLAVDKAQHVVEVIRLASRPGGNGVAALKAAWNELVVPDWPGAPTEILPLRRFANNGARVFFGSARLTQQGYQRKSLVTLYLVEADDRFEPFVVIQASVDEAMLADMSEAGAPDVSHPLVESLFKGVNGSPTGLPLVDDAELVGNWKTSSGAQQQYINVVTGSTGYTAVSSAMWWSFEASHDFSYRFSGAVTNTGSTQFSGQTDRGTWRIEHDLLVTDGEVLKRRYFFAGAGEGVGGKRVLVLMPEGKWTLSPGAIVRDAQMYEEE